MLVFGVVVAVVAIAGVGLGMLVAPRLGRMSDRISEPKDEDAGDGTD